MDEEDESKRLSKMAGPPSDLPRRLHVEPLEDRLGAAPSDLPGSPGAHTLEYRSANSLQPAPAPLMPLLVQFLLGFFGGTGLSTVAWISGDHPGQHTESLAWIYSILFVKIFGGSILMAFRRFRPVGAGLLTSFALGCLIFGYGFFSHCHY
jgi:hypothetical protein